MKKIDYNKLAYFNHNWLKTRHHFSFANYYDPKNIGYGKIRVINDDILISNNGFDPHPHKNMEIITYIINGELTHGDNMGNKRTLERGNVQYMSAGSGVIHSEYNNGKLPLRLIQIWIYPDSLDLKPQYGDIKYDESDRKNKLLKIVSGTNGDGLIKIYQDVDIFVTEVDSNTKLSIPLDNKLGFYIINLEGE